MDREQNMSGQKLRNTVGALLLGALAIGSMSSATQAADCNKDTLCRMMVGGKLKAGVVVDYKPWGYRGQGGEYLGLEPDMARDVAKTLGVEVEFVPVNSANRMEFLAQGQIDLMIATMTDNLKRREVIGIVHPNYYSSGYNIIMPKTAKPPNWDAMKGQKICAIQGSWYNRPAQEKFREMVNLPHAAAEPRRRALGACGAEGRSGQSLGAFHVGDALSLASLRPTACLGKGSRRCRISVFEAVAREAQRPLAVNFGAAWRQVGRCA
jgi:Bacterial extracellular solute-binding proteins, family 3